MVSALQENPTYLATRISDLLVETATAHDRYEKEALGGKRDDRWARWYAAYLRRNGLPELLDTMPGETLVLGYLENFLGQADEVYRSQNPAEDWPTFYSRYLLRLASGQGEPV
jgi:hypothetical protein